MTRSMLPSRAKGPFSPCGRRYAVRLRCVNTVALWGGGTLLAIALAACAQPADPQPTYLALDCAKPFDAQVAAITSQGQLNAAGVVGSEPYSYYSATDGRTSYLITRPGSPAHPAIMIQRARGGITTTGCRYGSQKGYDELLAYLESLKTWTRTGGVKK